MRDPTPAYYRIFQTLRQRIASGDFPAGAQLPTEEELMREFAVSRHTIRSSVQQLAVQGLVRKQAGKGTFVLDPAADGRQWAAQSLDDIVDRNFGNVVDAPAMVALEPGCREEEEARRRLLTDEPVVRFTWLRQLDIGPSAFATVYMPQSCAARLPGDWATQLQTTRLLHLVEKFGGFEAFRVRQLSSAVAADRDLSRILDVPMNAPLLSLERTYYDRSGRIIEHSKILARPDRCEPIVELFRVGRSAP